jgi:acyl-CoA synthetase (NDP forming)
LLTAGGAALSSAGCRLGFEPEVEQSEQVTDDRIRLAIRAQDQMPARGDLAQRLEAVSLPFDDLEGGVRAPARVVRSVSAAASAARDLGWPVALKVVARGLLHKRDVGTVATSLRTAADVRRAAKAVQASVTAAGYELDGFLVQRMIPDGVELLLGMVQDASFGPVVACGAGGTNTELFKEVAVRITPVTDRDAAEMVRGLQFYPLLTGYRGSRPCNIAAVENMLMRIGAMVDAHPEIAELDCNPGHRRARRRSGR